MAAPPSVLTIDTLIRRETVRIDGVTYDLRTDKELSIFDLTRLNRASDQMQALEDDPTISIDRLEEYHHILGSAVRLILVAPEAVHARLLTAHQEAILWTFIGLSRRGRPPTRATPDAPTPTPTPPPPRPRTRSRSAPGSRGSTGAPRETG